MCVCWLRIRSDKLAYTCQVSIVVFLDLGRKMPGFTPFFLDQKIMFSINYASSVMPFLSIRHSVISHYTSITWDVIHVFQVHVRCSGLSAFNFFLAWVSVHGFDKDELWAIKMTKRDRKIHPKFSLFRDLKRKKWDLIREWDQNLGIIPGFSGTWQAWTWGLLLSFCWEVLSRVCLWKYVWRRTDSWNFYSDTCTALCTHTHRPV